MKKIALIASGMMMLALSANLALGAEISDDSVDKLLKLSGVKDGLSQIQDSIKAGAEQARQKEKATKQVMSDSEFRKVRGAMVDAFAPSVTLQAVRTEIKNKVSDADAKELLAWYESDLGKKITKAEKNGSTPSALKKMNEQAQSLMADKKRVQFAKKLDSLLKLTDLALQRQEDIGAAVYVAYSAAANKTPNIKQFKSAVAPKLKEVRPNVEQFIILATTYTYKDIDPADLDKYLAFLKQRSTKRFNDSILKGMADGVHQSLDQVSKSSTDVFKNRKS